MLLKLKVVTKMPVKISKLFTHFSGRTTQFICKELKDFKSFVYRINCKNQSADPISTNREIVVSEYIQAE